MAAHDAAENSVSLPVQEKQPVSTEQQVAFCDDLYDPLVCTPPSSDPASAPSRTNQESTPAATASVVLGPAPAPLSLRAGETAAGPISAVTQLARPSTQDYLTAVSARLFRPADFWWRIRVALILLFAVCTFAYVVTRSPPLLMYDWKANSFARDVFLQAQQPCTPLTPAELARGELFGGERGVYSLGRVQLLLCDKLLAENSAALPLYALGWEFNRCIIATRVDGKCAVLANPLAVHQTGQVQAALTNSILQTEYAPRLLPDLLTVLAVDLSAGRKHEWRVILRGTDAAVVAHWIETGAQGHYGDFMSDADKPHTACRRGQPCDHEL